MTNKNNNVLPNDIDLENVRNIGTYPYEERTNKPPADNEYCKSHPNDVKTKEHVSLH